jgi:non-ribosomal peptide synthetase component E (peptide arylation enzyme)
MIDYVKLSILIGTFFAGCVVGYYPVHVAYSNYKLEVQTAAKAQEAHVASIEKQHQLVTKSIAKEYDAKISAIRNYYKSTSVWNNPSSSKVSGLSTAPSATDVIAAYNELALRCAETTAQTIALQDWLREQMGIK